MRSTVSSTSHTCIPISRAVSLYQHTSYCMFPSLTVLCCSLCVHAVLARGFALAPTYHLSLRLRPRSPLPAPTSRRREGTHHLPAIRGQTTQASAPHTHVSVTAHGEQAHVLVSAIRGASATLADNHAQGGHADTDTCAPAHECDDERWACVHACYAPRSASADYCMLVAVPPVCASVPVASYMTCMVPPPFGSMHGASPFGSMHVCSFAHAGPLVDATRACMCVCVLSVCSHYHWPHLPIRVHLPRSNLPHPRTPGVPTPTRRTRYSPTAMHPFQMLAGRRVITGLGRYRQHAQNAASVLARAEYIGVCGAKDGSRCVHRIAHTTVVACRSAHVAAVKGYIQCAVCATLCMQRSHEPA